LSEFAREYAGHINGKVTDGDGNAVDGANLNLTKDVYHTALAENVVDRVFWDPKTHTNGAEGPASTATAANTKPDWRGVNWALYAPWGHGVNTNTANLDPALEKIAPDIQAWFAANPPKSRYYDDLVAYKNPTTGDVFQTTVEKQGGYMEIQNVDGTFSWSVLPSQQPETYAYEGRNQPNWTGGTAVNIRRGTAAGFEVDSPTDPRIGKFIYEDEGYDIVAKAPGYYNSAINTVFVEDYKAVKNDVNFTISKAITTDFDFGYVYGGNDVSVAFTTYLPNGVKGIVNGANVTVTIGGVPATVTSLGGGDYVATFSPNAASLATLDSAELVIDFVGGAGHSAYTGTVLFDTVIVKLGVPGLSFLGNDIDYIVSLENAANVLTVDLTVEIDGSKLIGTDIIGLGGFEPINNILWVNASGNTWKGTATLTYEAGGGSTGFTGAGDIAAFVFAPKAVGNAVVKIAAAKVSGLYEGTTKFLKSVISGGVSTTVVASNKYDLNRDGKVDALDLGIVLLYCGFKAADTEWDTFVKVNDAWGNPLTAKDADVNADGIVNMLDLIDVFINYTK
ncbi:MAG: hypothetical protein FWG42_12335, partial [Clostridiales bacterium]|nr:hypothetical protein [Clostridiales bacterium]